jgi:hypothetical protein
MANGNSDVAGGKTSTGRRRERISEEEADATMKRQITQSSIAFPYMDLETAVSVAMAMFGAGGVPLTRTTRGTDANDHHQWDVQCQTRDCTCFRSNHFHPG